MAYNKQNFYEKLIEIQDIVLRERKRGVTYTWIFRNLIEKQYHISYSTFNEYLGISAKGLLKKLLETKAVKKSVEPELFN